MLNSWLEPTWRSALFNLNNEFIVWYVSLRTNEAVMISKLHNTIVNIKGLIVGTVM